MTDDTISAAARAQRRARARNLLRKIEAEPDRLPSLAPAPEVESEVEEVRTAVIPPVTPKPVSPPATATSLTQLSQLYGVPETSFISDIRLKGLTSTAEPNWQQWQWPNITYLTAQQARQFGFDVPEGALVEMSPYMGGEVPTFRLLESPEQIASPQLTASLRNIYPEMFRPDASFGVAPGNIPVMVVQSIRSWAADDLRGFTTDLYDRVGANEGQRILRELGFGEDTILRTMDAVQQEDYVMDTIQAVMPDMESIDQFTSLLETDWQSFFDEIRLGGGSKQKRQLLELIGLNPDQINEIWMRPRLRVEVDGIRTILDIDLTTKAAYDLQGNYVGMYNPATKEFTRAPRKTIIRESLDAFNFASLGLGKNMITFTSALMKDFFYRDIPADKSKRTPIEKLFSDDTVESLNAMNARQRAQWEEVYAENEASYDDWMRKHPEIIPSVLYQEGAFQHPELLKDTNYIAYEIASMIPIVGTMVAASAVGGPPLAIGIMTTVEGGALYSELLDAGAPADKAIELATAGGAIIGALEYVGRIPLLKRLNATVFGQFKREATRELARQGLAQTIKKFGRTFTIAQFAESLTEVAQEVVSNAAIKVYDENRSVFENTPDIFVKTMIATFPYSLFGAGVDVRMVTPREMSGLSDLQKKAKGWLQDAKGNWFAAVEEARISPERGAIVPGAEPRRPSLPSNLEVVGRQISEQLDVTYEGVQEGFKNVPSTMLFTDKQTGSTFAANSLEEARTKLTDMRAKFAKPEVTPAPEVTRAVDEYSATDIYANDLSGQIRQEGIDEGAIAGKPYIDYKGQRIEYNEAQTARYNEAQKLPRQQRNIAEHELSLEVAGIRERPSKLAEGMYKIVDGEKVLVTPTAPAVEVIAKEPIVETAIEQTRQTEPVVPPPPTDGARKVYERIEFEPEHTNFIDKIRRGWHRFNVTMVDELFAIKQLTDQLKKGGVALSIEENPYLAARLLKGISGKANVFLEKGTFGKKFWKMVKGKAVPNFTGESLETILQEVKDPQVWRDFSTYLVAKRTVQLSARNIETGIALEDAQSAISELETKYNNFPNLAERVYKYQDSLLVYANEMGLVSMELLEKLRKFGDYVPFYRVMNELQAKGLMGKKMADIAQPIKKIQGSEREIINPLESIVKNTYVIIQSADRNQVGIMLANLADKFPQVTEVFERVKTPIARVAGVTAKELGVEIEGMTDADAEAIVDIFRPSFFTRGDEVTVLIDGKKQYFKVDPDIRNTLLNLDAESLGMLGKILGAPARWLRAGATLSPDFMVRNPARDQLTAYAYSNYGFIPGVDFLRGLASVIAKDADYQLYRASGAEHSMLVSMDREYLQKTFKEIVEGRNFTFYVKHPMELLRIVSELGEKATRLGEFKAGIRRGAMPLEAGYSSRAVSLDFSQMGTTARAVNTLIAFFNANIRGWGRMISSFKEHPARTSAKVFMGITMPSILLYYANRDDERWKEIPQWQKDLFWIVFVGDNIYRIPKPFELGIIFGSMPERFLEWLDNKDPKMFEEAMANLIEAGSPGVIPTAGLPILEWMTNYSFFRGTKIVPSSREKMPPELQYLPYTSEFSKKIGELIKQSPAKIDNLINGYTAGLGRYAVDILDGILKGTGLVPDIPEPSPTLVDIPVIKAFVVRNPYGSSGATVERFYDTLTEFEQGEKYLKEMLELGNEDKFEQYKAEHPELLFFYQMSDDPEKEGVSYSATARYLRRVARDLTELRNKQDAIYKDKDMSPEEKRRLIDEIDILKTDVARKALDFIIDDPQALISTKLNESIGKLGSVIEDEPNLSLIEPDIYTMRKLWTEFGATLEAVTSDDLSKLEGIDELAFRYLETKEVKTETDALPNKRLYEIVPELKTGVTFEDYYKSWQSGLFKDENLSRLSREEQRLLREYHKLGAEGKQQFLIDHPEVSVNPRKDWLESHPKENAMLAIWGQTNLLTKESYDEFKKLVNEWDIPQDALPDILPDNLEVFSLRTAQFRDVEKQIERYRLVDGDRFKDEIAELKQTKIDGMEYRDIERKIDILRKKTDEIDITDEIVQAHIDYGRIIDEPEHGASSAEAMLFRVDDPNYDKFRTDFNIWGDQALKPIDETRIPIWRIDAKYRQQDAEYDALATTGERQAYLQANPEYRMDSRRREAYSLSNAVTGEKFPTTEIENYVGYYELPDKGFRQERFLLDNPDFAQVMHTIKGMDLPKPEDVPSVEYDNITEEWQDDFNKWGGLADNTSDFYIEDTVARDAERDRMLFTSAQSDYFGIKFYGTKKMTGFGLALLTRDAHYALKKLQDNPDYKTYVDDYVQWFKLGREGKPEGWADKTKTDKWYEDDWFLMENEGFYKNVYLGVFENERRDFRKVPSREVFGQYVEYLTKVNPGKPRDDYRWTHPELDAWLVEAFDYIPITEKKRREELTPLERGKESIAEQEAEWEKQLEEIERILAGLK